MTGRPAQHRFDRDGFFDMLADSGILSPDNIARARTASRQTNLPFDRVFSELGLLPEEDICRLFRRYCDCPAEVESGIRPDMDLAGMIGLDYLNDRAIAPLQLDDQTITLLLADPFDMASIEAVAFKLDRQVVAVIAPRSAVEARLGDMGGAAPDIADTPEQPLNGLFDDDLDRLRDIALEAPVVAFVSRTIQRAIEAGATDIHIEPLSDRLQVRFRRDGILTSEEPASLAIAAGVVTRIKILARLNIVERRLPQDGRMRLATRGQEKDFRVSITPCVHGETIVLRLLKDSGLKLDLRDLGYAADAARSIGRLAGYANGIVAMTGPTGSGKTTSLYALVSSLDRLRHKIFTVEDPVEYRIDGITQMQVHSEIGLDFARSLRSVLRQDPDIILVGEIRDRETARIAIQAALTGHLVLTTLHTNSAIGAVTRLRDMGVEPYLIAATLRGAIAQRLVRKICPSCHGSGRDEAGKACQPCAGEGYAGRTAIYEILEASPTLSAMISDDLNE
jgi:general secretion pathway protein E